MGRYARELGQIPAAAYSEALGDSAFIVNLFYALGLASTHRAYSRAVRKEEETSAGRPIS